MRTTATMILVTLICLGINGQTVLDPKKGPASAAACILTYADNQWAIEHNDTAHHQCQTIAIASLPAMNQASTPMNLFITTMGTYSLKKDPKLVIAEEYNIVVEDLLTGQYYNLKSQEPYTFKMNRGFGQTRFMLEISKTNAKVVSAAAGK